MARDKATVTLDRKKAATAKVLVHAKSLSETYARRPPTDEELGIADLPVQLDLGDEDVDYDAIYGKRR
jgi:hypothetical protein